MSAVLFKGTTTDDELNFTVARAVAEAPKYLLLPCFRTALDKYGACAETEEARALLAAAGAAGVVIPATQGARDAAAAAVPPALLRPALVVARALARRRPACCAAAADKSALPTA